MKNDRKGVFNIFRNAAQKTGEFFGSFGKVEIKQGDRIAQIVIEKCYSAKWTEVEELSDSERDEGGFGSSGI